MTSPGPYKIGTVSRLSGISPGLLRAWERRYSLLRPGRGPGGHRLYTADDLRVLDEVRRLRAEGRSIGEIAALGRGHLAGHAPVGPSPGGPAAPGPVLASACAELVAAALSLRADRIHRILDGISATYSSDVVVERVIAPVSRNIGELWQAGACPVASEHLISSIFRHRMLNLMEAAGSPDGLPTAAATCLPGEEHDLGLLMMSYFVTRAGIRVLYLGPSLPLEACVEACGVAKPDALLISVTIPGVFLANRAGLSGLAGDLEASVRVYLGGRAVPASDPELEECGLRLIPGDRSPSATARKVAAEIRSHARVRRRDRPARLSPDVPGRARPGSAPC